MVTDQTLRTKGLGNRLREADLRFLVMLSASIGTPPPPEPGSVSSLLGVHDGDQLASGRRLLGLVAIEHALGAVELAGHVIGVVVDLPGRAP